MMRFILYENAWAFQGETPQDIMKELGVPINMMKVNPIDEPDEEYAVVTLGPEQITKILQSDKYDVMATKHMRVGGWKLLCFDVPGKCFRQRG
jgi:hypothetical protein